VARTVLTKRAQERGTYGIEVGFLDDADADVIPTSAKWSLTDLKGAVVNDREDEDIASLDSTVAIVLTGDDLQIFEEEIDTPAKRLVTVEFVYDSDLGANLPGKAEIEFSIDNLVKIV
jgi:hypothetical protein